MNNFIRIGDKAINKNLIINIRKCCPVSFLYEGKGLTMRGSVEINYRYFDRNYQEYISSMPIQYDEKDKSRVEEIINQWIDAQFNSMMKIIGSDDISCVDIKQFFGDGQTV